MLHACVQRFDVTSTVGNFLGTKQGLNRVLYLPFNWNVQISNVMKGEVNKFLRNICRTLASLMLDQ